VSTPIETAQQLDRRSGTREHVPALAAVKRSAMMGAGLAAAGGVATLTFALAKPAFAGKAAGALGAVTPDLNDCDVVLLQFLAAAELVKSDPWGQYSELATNNSNFSNALIHKGTLPDSVNGDFAAETSHANFSNAFLMAAGKAPVNLDSFRTLPSVPVQGVRQFGCLTNLANLTVNTGYYQRYRSEGNPDFGDPFHKP